MALLKKLSMLQTPWTEKRRETHRSDDKTWRTRSHWYSHIPWIQYVAAQLDSRRNTPTDETALSYITLSRPAQICGGQRKNEVRFSLRSWMSTLQLQAYLFHSYCR